MCQAVEVIRMVSWSGKGSGIQALDAYTRWPLYLTSASEAWFVPLLVNSDPDVPAGQAAVLMALALAHAVTCLLLLRAGLTYYLGGRRPATALVVLAVVLAVAGVVVAGQDGGGVGIGMATGGSALLFCAALIAAVTPLLSMAQLGLAVALSTVAVVVVQNVIDSGDLAWAANYALVTAGVAGTYRFSVWYLGIVWEMSRSRQVEAKLAVAEERLRFARDLHDVLGRNLALIAVNSQLAAELVRRGQDGAIERMLDVHRTAQDSMREVREVVAGSRTTDLDAELAGARSVLQSAGISARVIGEGALLPSAAQATFGWVVREATTNIIRHSDPTTVRIELALGDGSERVAVMRIENDGAPDQSIQDDRGTGLAGLRERLVVLGGTLDAGPAPGGRFLVEARLPVETES
jgi:two-component system sensor histidine kinase DesK